MKGLSLVVSKSDIILTQKEHQSKMVSEETIVWFDIEAKEKVQMRLIPISQEPLGHE